MQAITIAIGKNGINFFAHELVADDLVSLLSALKPPDRTIQIGDFVYNDWSFTYKAENTEIYLTQGKLHNFSTKFQSISQQVSGVFPLTMRANDFSAQYAWEEKYNKYQRMTGPKGGQSYWDLVGPVDDTFTYTPAFSGLTVTVPVQFKYNNNEWEVIVLAPTANATNTQANIPSNSVIQYEEGCYSHHVSDASAAAVSAIDFSTPISTLIKGIIASIPGSGNLGNGIVYDFSLSEPGNLLFPNNDGIQIGVKGGASYKGAQFSGDTPPKLPLPLPPSDTDNHHLNMYVSNYEVDALHWAFFKAGELDTIVNPTDILDPGALKVATYVNLEKSLNSYKAFAMQAHISPIAAPVTVFELVWEFTAAAMALLKQQLPQNVYDLLSGLQGNAYASKSALEDDLKGATVPPSYFQTIENAAQRMGMVVTSNLNFDLVIQNGQPQMPDIKFSLARTDVLANLRLGIGGNNAQTMQYDFLNVNFNAAFISSTVPGFAGTNFGNVVWPVGGEPRYEQILADMGKTGVPLPIMKNFQFDFTNAELSIQEGYISILASVLYKNK